MDTLNYRIAPDGENFGGTDAASSLSPLVMQVVGINKD